MRVLMNLLTGWFIQNLFGKRRVLGSIGTVSLCLRTKKSAASLAPDDPFVAVLSRCPLALGG